MYRGEDDFYKSRRHNSHRDDERRYGESRRVSNRWDDRKYDNSSSRSRWDDASRGRRDDHQSKNRRESEDRGESRSKSRWSDSKRGYEKSAGRSPGKRDRSRSHSPFRRNEEDYLNYSNPTRSPKQNPSSNNNPSERVEGKKYSSWSDSSDEDDRLGKPKREQIQSHQDEQRHIDFDQQRQQSSTSITYRIMNDRNPMNESHIKPAYPVEEMVRDFGVSQSSTTGGTPGISLKLGAQPSKPMPLPKVISVSVAKKATTVAAVFDSDDDDEPEEMPAECKMRMKNVGRETKTSEGPNSFGKTKIGFCNLSHLAEKELQGKSKSNNNKKT